jgi:hypothetical protein
MENGLQEEVQQKKDPEPELLEFDCQCARAQEEQKVESWSC